jgi:nucleotide-binding universal stress UspA family protein
LPALSITEVSMLKKRRHPLIGACRELQAGLVVMGAYGLSILYEFFLGSVTRTMLAESPAPLFLYH